MTTLEELIKQRDTLDEQIEALKNKQESEEFEQVESKYLNQIVRQYRKEYDDIIFIKVQKVSKYNGIYSLIGDGVYMESPKFGLTKCKNEQIELYTEYDTRIVTKDEMKQELNNILYEYF